MRNDLQPGDVVRVKSKSPLKAIAVAGTVAALLAFSTEAFAQRLPTTCSDARQMCLELTAKGRKSNPAGCERAFASCMKTGTFVGLLGRRFPVTK
jgi:hypothetical protein